MSPAGIRTVARQELRLRIRAGRWRWLLGVWFAVLLLFTVLLRLAIGSVDGTLVDGGVVVYGGLVLFVLGLALLVVPALAAQSVNGDRERGTLATLQVTRLTAGDIALGTFAAAWGSSLVFLALTLPMTVYAMTQGGVTLGRVLATTIVMALLLGSVCAIALALSALLARTTTSGVLTYLAVFALTVGTLVAFGLASATTSETYTQTVPPYCPKEADLPPDLPPMDKAKILASCNTADQTYTATRLRTDRTWWLLAPNPFVVLADSAPTLPPLTPAQRRTRDRLQAEGRSTTDVRDVDPLGNLGRTVRELRDDPTDKLSTHKAVWPLGLAVDVALGAAALVLTTRRLRTPSRNLPRGQRVA